jgi:hypothetical protein
VARCDVPRRECLHHHVYGHLRDPKPNGHDSARALCPAHDDTERSLGVSVGEAQRIVYHCFAGCDELAVREGLIRDGTDPGCLPVSRARRDGLADQIKGLYAKDLHHAELRLRVWSLVQGFGGELPAKGRYPGGRRAFAEDAGVGRTEMYDGGFNR